MAKKKFSQQIKLFLQKTVIFGVLIQGILSNGNTSVKKGIILKVKLIMQLKWFLMRKHIIFGVIFSLLVLSCVQDAANNDFEVRYLVYVKDGITGKPIDSVRVKLFLNSDTLGLLKFTNNAGEALFPYRSTSASTAVLSASKLGYKLGTFSEEIALPDSGVTQIQKLVEFELTPDSILSRDSLDKLRDSLLMKIDSLDTLSLQKEDSLMHLDSIIKLRDSLITHQDSLVKSLTDSLNVLLSSSSGS